MIIYTLNQLARTDLAVAGGKGANLGELTRLGIGVPPGFVISATAYAEQAQALNLAERLSPLIAAKNWDAAATEATTLLEKSALPPHIESAIREAYRNLGAGLVAVRSSATAEDLADASFAGQHETYLDIAGEENVLVAVRQCWASLWNSRALQYRATRTIDHFDVNIAVVVQKMVPAEFAGVLFTVDPVTQRIDRMLVELAQGLGEAIVSGHTTGDVYRLRREPNDLAIVERKLQKPGGAVPNDKLVLELGRIGLRLESHFGCPQDVEFAFAEGAVHILQSRPITTLEQVEIEPIPPPPKLNRLQKKMSEANDADRFPISPKPLDQWTLRMVMPSILRAMRSVGFIVEETDERAMLEELWRESFVPPKLLPSLRLIGLPKQVATNLRYDWMTWWQNEALPLILDVCAPVDLRALDDSALLRRADRIFETTSGILDRRFQAVFSQAAMAVLAPMVILAVGKNRSSSVMGDLLSGLHTRTSEVNIALFHLARKAANAGAEVTGAIREGRIGVLGESEAGRALLADVDVFLEKHGHRESTGLYLSTPTWQQDPTPMWGVLRTMLDTTEPPSNETGMKRHQAARDEITHKLRFLPGSSRAFQNILDQLRKVIIFREQSHFDMCRAYSALQSIAAEIARRLQDRGLLLSTDDIFYLTESEMRAWLGGNAPSVDEAKKFIRRRRATYAVVNGNYQKNVFGAGKGASGGELRGTGASSGVVRGIARVIHNESEFGRLNPGEILVCRYTNPAWTPLFTIAKGVITDAGGAGSHAAIVAREYGLPAVLGVVGATTHIADGQEVLVDGTEGRVTLLRRAAAGEVVYG